MSRTDEIFKPALLGKNIPILTLDHTWHKLFSQAYMTPEIEAMEKKLNELLKRQGRVNSDMKGVKVIKKRLMDEIVSLADKYDETKSPAVQKDIEEHKRLVEECNVKMDALEEEAMDLPRTIHETNLELMLLTMETCYARLDENKKEIDEAQKWIEDVRQQLKKTIIRKQEKEYDTYALYSYMHNIFGPDVINLFDLHYHPEQYAPKPKLKDSVKSEQSGEIESEQK